MGNDYSVFWASNREFAKSAILTGLSSPGAYPIDMLAFGLGDGHGSFSLVPTRRN